MSSTRKNHPANFKAKVALAAFREDAPISELAIKYGGHATVSHRWKREALASMEGGAGKLAKTHTDHEAQLHELHAKIGQLSVERDFLVDASNRLGEEVSRHGRIIQYTAEHSGAVSVALHQPRGLGTMNPKGNPR